MDHASMVTLGTSPFAGTWRGARQTRLRALLPLLVMLTVGPAALAEAESAVEEITVTGDRSLSNRQQGVGSIDALTEDEVTRIMPVHVHESLVRIPGVWISRGSGQEHLTAIRSAVLTGPGACGEFLFLENGVSMRPTGFCNVNQLFELNFEQAAAIEVVRGPGGALYGGNAIHGMINVLTPAGEAAPRITAEVGPHAYRHLRASASTAGGGPLWRADLHATDTNGYQRDTGYRQQKMTLTQIGSVGAWQVHTAATGTNLAQDTGGFVQGFEIYRDRHARRANANPEAFRDAWALRLLSEWTRSFDGTDDLARDLVVTPYLRRSRMEFLQHFLPGQPLERNGQTSAGVNFRYRVQYDNLDWRAGTQLEWADGFLFERQDQPAVGAPAVVETRPLGLHYDYDVRSLMAAGFYDLRWQLTDTLALVHGSRIEWLRYDYDNNMRDGNTREDGSECGFGGCLFNRPADRTDTYTNIAARLGLEQRLGDQVMGYALIGTGFRPPQATELYRLQRGQDVADLDSQRMITGELGLRALAAGFDIDAVLFANRSDRIILRDANGFNVSDGRTRAWGVELGMWRPLADWHEVSLALTYARHRYAFDRQIGGGETITSGNEVNTAPHWLGSAQWLVRPVANVEAELEVVYNGPYYLNASNTARYDGHLLWNLRASWQLSDRVRLFGRITNLTDENYANRADFAFGNYRYFIGTPRQFFAGIDVTL
jgi:iron complex outermembrane recepter protein